jgi:hypothetical protein
LQPIPALTALPALLHLGLPLGLALGTWLLAAGPLVIERWYATFRHLRGWDRRRLPRS